MRKFKIKHIQVVMKVNKKQLKGKRKDCSKVILLAVEGDKVKVDNYGCQS